MYKIGIDIGGTFTDIILFDGYEKRIYFRKVPSTPEDPSKGMLAGIEAILKEANLETTRVDLICHGSTVATNALIEKRGARTGLITTNGFRDVYEIRRQIRPTLYDLNFVLSEPLVPRYLRKGVEERILYNGKVHTDLKIEDCRNVTKYFVEKGVESIAVCLINSYSNPAHEEKIGEIIKNENQGLFVTLSSTVFPEYKEYERTNMTIIHAYLKPVLEKYLDKVISKLEELGLPRKKLYMMQSDGGIMYPDVTKEYPARTISSGPAGGVMGVKKIRELLKIENIIGLDMGGTSTDISIIRGDEIIFTKKSKVENDEVYMRMIEIDSIGSGGGSIGWMDAMGVLNVGPKSMGANPGPACYGFGGNKPTITDACLVLGYLDPDFFLGGEMKLDKKKSVEVIKADISNKLGMEVEEAAMAIFKIATTKMANQIIQNLAKKGYAPDDFALLTFGGAGGLFACSLMEALGIKQAVVPEFASGLSALGLISADGRFEFSKTLLFPLDKIPHEIINKWYEESKMKILDMFGGSALDKDTAFVKQADIRYIGQGSELTVTLPEGELNKSLDAEIKKRFDEEYARVYNYSLQESPIEVVNWRLTGIKKSVPIELPKHEKDYSNYGLKNKCERLVLFKNENNFINCKAFDKKNLLVGEYIPGPMIVEEYGTTTVVPPGYKVKVDFYANLIIERG